MASVEPKSGFIKAAKADRIWSQWTRKEQLCISQTQSASGVMSGILGVAGHTVIGAELMDLSQKLGWTPETICEVTSMWGSVRSSMTPAREAFPKASHGKEKVHLFVLDAADTADECHNGLGSQDLDYLVQTLPPPSSYLSQSMLDLSPISHKKDTKSLKTLCKAEAVMRERLYLLRAPTARQWWKFAEDQQQGDKPLLSVEVTLPANSPQSDPLTVARLIRDPDRLRVSFDSDYMASMAPSARLDKNKAQRRLQRAFKNMKHIDDGPVSYTSSARWDHPLVEATTMPSPVLLDDKRRAGTNASHLRPEKTSDTQDDDDKLREVLQEWIKAAGTPEEKEAGEVSGAKLTYYGLVEPIRGHDAILKNGSVVFVRSLRQDSYVMNILSPMDERIAFDKALGYPEVKMYLKRFETLEDRRKEATEPSLFFRSELQMFAYLFFSDQLYLKPEMFETAMSKFPSDEIRDARNWVSKPGQMQALKMLQHLQTLSASLQEGGNALVRIDFYEDRAVRDVLRFWISQFESCQIHRSEITPLHSRRVWVSFENYRPVPPIVLAARNIYERYEKAHSIPVAILADKNQLFEASVEKRLNVMDKAYEGIHQDRWERSQNILSKVSKKKEMNHVAFASQAKKQARRLENELCVHVGDNLDVFLSFVRTRLSP